MIGLVRFRRHGTFRTTIAPEKVESLQNVSTQLRLAVSGRRSVHALEMGLRSRVTLLH